jgi:hypothetical protein
MILIWRCRLRLPSGASGAERGCRDGVRQLHDGGEVLLFRSRSTWSRTFTMMPVAVVPQHLRGWITPHNVL